MKLIILSCDIEIERENQNLMKFFWDLRRERVVGGSFQMGRSDIWGSQREEGNRRRRGVNGFFFFFNFSQRRREWLVIYMLVGCT